MNLRDLHYFITLVEQKHFGRAAEACFVSQPALSMQIKKLEDMLGVQLIERTHRSILLTEVGKLIYEHAQKILIHSAEIKELAKKVKDPFSGDLYLGIIPTLAPYLLPRIIIKLKKLFPKLTFYLIEAQTNQLLSKLKEGKIDAALLALPISEDEINSISLFEEEFMLAVPEKHFLAKRKRIKENDLQDLNLLLLEDGHCLREQALTLCHRMQATEAKNFKATSLETLRHMVTAKVGITLMPKLACNTQSGICYIPFSLPKPKRTVGIIWRETSAKKTMLNELSQQLKNLMAMVIKTK